MNNNEKKIVVLNSDNIPQQYIPIQQLASLRSLVKEKIRENFNSTEDNTQNNDNSNQSTYSRHGNTRQFTFVHVSSVHVSSVNISKKEVVQPKEEIERQKAKERIGQIIKGIFIAILHIILFRGHSCCDCR
jgi:outer membrane cobalamin receptor